VSVGDCCVSNRWLIVNSQLCLREIRKTTTNPSDGSRPLADTRAWNLHPQNISTLPTVALANQILTSRSHVDAVSHLSLLYVAVSGPAVTQ
jgi:hypothetical protein